MNIYKDYKLESSYISASLTVITGIAFILFAILTTQNDWYFLLIDTIFTIAGFMYIQLGKTEFREAAKMHRFYRMMK